MSPVGLILIGIGMLMIVIGYKGSQHSVMNAFKGIKGTQATSKSGGGKVTPKVSPNQHPGDMPYTYQPPQSPII